MKIYQGALEVKNNIFLKRMWIMTLVIVCLCGLLLGCSTKESTEQKIKDLKFTVVEDLDVPSEIKELIDEKKIEPFQFTYATKSNLYLVVGYGKQETGGFSITMDELYETQNSVCMKTTLIGPGSSEKKENVKSYPYLVVRTEFIDKRSVFE